MSTPPAINWDITGQGIFNPMGHQGDEAEFRSGLQDPYETLDTLDFAGSPHPSDDLASLSGFGTQPFGAFSNPSPIVGGYPVLGSLDSNESYLWSPGGIDPDCTAPPPNDLEARCSTQTGKRKRDSGADGQDNGPAGRCPERLSNHPWDVSCEEHYWKHGIPLDMHSFALRTHGGSDLVANPGVAGPRSKPRPSPTAFYNGASEQPFITPLSQSARFFPSDSLTVEFHGSVPHDEVPGQVAESHEETRSANSLDSDHFDREGGEGGEYSVARKYSNSYRYQLPLVSCCDEPIREGDVLLTACPLAARGDKEKARYSTEKSLPGFVHAAKTKCATRMLQTTDRPLNLVSAHPASKDVLGPCWGCRSAAPTRNAEGRLELSGICYTASHGYTTRTVDEQTGRQSYQTQAINHGLLQSSRDNSPFMSDRAKAWITTNKCHKRFVGCDAHQARWKELDELRRGNTKVTPRSARPHPKFIDVQATFRQSDTGVGSFDPNLYDKSSASTLWQKFQDHLSQMPIEVRARKPGPYVVR